jgi:hypothetical protein
MTADPTDFRCDYSGCGVFNTRHIGRAAMPRFNPASRVRNALIAAANGVDL